MPDLALRNWPLKLLSLILAFGIWAAVTGEGVVVQDYSVPLEVAVGPDATLVGSVPTTGTVRLRGPENLLRRIDPLRHEMELRVDLTETTPGERTVQMGAANLVGLPRGAEIAQILPGRLTLRVASRARRALPVVPSFRGQPPKGYAFYAADIVPHTLTVEGPAPEVAALSRLRTDPIVLDDHVAPFVARVGAVPDSPDVRVLEAGLLTVRVEVDVAPVERAFEAVPVVLAGQVYEAVASPPALMVVLSGPPALLARIEPGRIRAVVDLSDLAPRAEAYRLSPRVEFVDVPAGDLARITVKSVSRASVAVRLLDRRISP